MTKDAVGYFWDDTAPLELSEQEKKMIAAVRSHERANDEFLDALSFAVGKILDLDASVKKLDEARLQQHLAGVGSYHGPTDLWSVLHSAVGQARFMSSQQVALPPWGPPNDQQPWGAQPPA